MTLNSYVIVAYAFYYVISKCLNKFKLSIIVQCTLQQVKKDVNDFSWNSSMQHSL